VSYIGEKKSKEIMLSSILIVVLLLGILVAVGQESKYVDDGRTPTERCKTRYFDQVKDHFAFHADQATFKHRVLYNLEYHKPNGPIFFYLGNEANVELYVDHTGLMWENAGKFGAALVFAEHRYYGESRLFPDNACDMSLLTTEQALADYAGVLDTFKSELHPSAVIGFGGSYGGMLATVFRFQYPHMVDGVIAGSAPVLAYQGLDPPYDPNGFARVVTRDAGPKCAALVRTGLEIIFSAGKNKTGRDMLSKTFKLCRALQSQDEAEELLSWVSSYWDYLAMGDFPYPSIYVQPDGAPLPAYPVKAACRLVIGVSSNPVAGLALGANLFYNASHTKKCFFNEPNAKNSAKLLTFPRVSRMTKRIQEAPAACAGTWDWQWCTEHSMPFTSGTDKDMFYPPTGPFDPAETANGCRAAWGVRPNPNWARLTYGGIGGLRRGLKNVVFSNGLLDPWSAGGVLDTKGFHPSVVALLIPHGAHHLDLMFSHKSDPLDVKIARQVELMHIDKWIKEAQARQKSIHETLDEKKVGAEII
jgi:lysosomal Pro-X carboxypeptidase